MRGFIYQLAIFGVGFACSMLFTGNYLLLAILGAAFGFATPLASLKLMPEAAETLCATSAPIRGAGRRSIRRLRFDGGCDGIFSMGSFPH